MINKYDKILPKDFSWQTAVPKLPELDVKGLEEVLQQNQARLDQVGLLSEKKPQVLATEEDMSLYKTYQADIDKGLNEVTQAYAENVTKGNLAYKNLLGQIRKDWSPGGRADVLNQRYAGYQNALKETDKFYESDSSPVNKTLAKQNLQAQLKNPINYDPTTGKYSQISTPELYKNPDINKAVDEMLKEIKANGDTQFLGDFNKSWWIQKISTETRPEERIKLAFQALSQQPEYSSQIDRDAQYKALQVDPKKYQEAFVNKQNTALKSLSDLTEKAKTDPQTTKDLQNLLRSEGYNVIADGKYGSQTEKAAQEYLASKKKDVESNISGFDLNSQLRNDVSNSYLGYALRGAYTKRDIDPIFNQAMKARADIAAKNEENRINRYRAEQEFSPSGQAHATVVSGISQQLPELQKRHDDLKTQRDAVKTNLDKTISNSKTFNGWTLENVAIAYDKWSKVTGSTEAEKKANYQKLLNEGSGNYYFDREEVGRLYQEMNAPVTESSLKTALDTYGIVNAETNRFEEGQSQINSQYLNTEEGKQNLKRLEFFRRPGETDVELADRAINDPNSFKQTKYDMTGTIFNSEKFEPTKQFSEQRQKDIDNQTKNGKAYNWGSLGTYEVWTDSKDKILKPKLDAIASAVETGTGLNFTTFGKAGLNFKDNKGDDVNGQTKKVTGMGVALSGNKPILKVNVTFTNSEGKNKDGFTEIELVPGSPEAIQIRSALEKEYAEFINAGDVISAQGVLDNIEALKGADRLRAPAIDLQKEQLNLKNTNTEPIYRLDPVTGKLIDVTTYGWQAKDMNDDANVGGFNYKTYGFSTPSGNVLGNVMVDENGNKVLVPSNTGQVVYKSSSGIQKARTGKEILGRTPVEIKQTKEH